MFSGTYEVKFVYVFLKLFVSCLQIDRRNLKRKPTEVTFLPFLEPKILSMSCGLRTSFCLERCFNLENVSKKKLLLIWPCRLIEGLLCAVEFLWKNV